MNSMKSYQENVLNVSMTLRTGPRSQLPIDTCRTDDHYLVNTTQGRCVVCSKNTTKLCKSCGQLGNGIKNKDNNEPKLNNFLSELNIKVSLFEIEL